ncbi:CASP-like protein 5B1 [Olea europaea var. sylvestris]|uniref:CASP-like protein 5B1 n=1 Tax=Olea europaea var. sylvestris TaxID=158386 RepID=UPI000C1CE642|nr:CASP-like protein 5B1 [Olea europaea var. sylvestris]
MKELYGSPGTKSGLMLRIGQCLFAASSIGVMASATGFSTSTAFCYLIASMGLEFLWSFGLVCIEVHALKFYKDLHNQIIMSLFAVGDWVIAMLSLAAACSSAGVAVLFTKDTDFCKNETSFSCNMFPISIAFI